MVDNSQDKSIIEIDGVDSAIKGIRILYEDNHLLIVIKPKNMLSQADITGDPDLLTLMKKYIKQKYSKPGDVYLGLVHRLDRPVGGVMVFARTSKAAARLCAQFREHSAKKIYLAVVEGKIPVTGNVEKLESIIKKDVQRNISSIQYMHYVYQSEIAEQQSNNKRNQDDSNGNQENRCDHQRDRNGHVAKLEYKVISNKEIVNRYYSIIEIDLKTGKPHQIRAQLAASGFPISGDIKYGKKQHIPSTINHENNKTEHLALWAYKLEIIHPITKMLLVFTAPVPECFPWDLFDRALVFS